MARTRSQKRAAKLRNRAKRAAVFVSDAPGRVRRFFFGKARSGDAAELRLTFSGEPIPVDPDRPVESLKERAEAIAACEGRPPEGEA